jgi:hypothetical protein
LTQHGILPITYPLHTSNIFRVLDILLFGRLKAIRERLLRDLSFGRDLGHVIRIFRAYELATTSFTGRHFWERLDLGSNGEMR